MESLSYDELQDDELKSQFVQLFDAIHRIDSDSSEAEIIVALNDRVCREVTSKPILARIIKGNCSLLVACITRRFEQFHPAIKCLIEANPSVLLEESDNDIDNIINYPSALLGGPEHYYIALVHIIAFHPTHCVLMPWIATNYQWVLDHELLLEIPPVFNLLYRYAHRELGTTGYTSATIQQFLEAYPQGLTQVYDYDRGLTPLHAILLWGPDECELDLFKWIAKQCPSNMLGTDNDGWTPLHIACHSLAYYLLDDTHHVVISSRNEICKYLIAKCPESVRIPDNDGWLPIHLLLRHCQHPLVKEVLCYYHTC